jgi:hypothetical protein
MKKKKILLVFNCTLISNYCQNAAETFENNNASRGKMSVAFIPDISENLIFHKDRDNWYFKLRILRSVFL